MMSSNWSNQSMKEKLILFLIILFSCVYSQAAIEQGRTRDFSEGISSMEFCGINCFKTNSGESIELSQMSCFELESVLINSIDSHEDLENRLEEVIQEGSEESLYFSLAEDHIPRIQNRLSLIQYTINLKCMDI